MNDRSHPGLNIAAFVLPPLAGLLALKADAFLFLALFFIAAGTSLFHPSNRLKTAARYSLSGFLFGIFAMLSILFIVGID